MSEPSAETRLCALIGDPVEHSLSPVMHNAAFRALGLDLMYCAFRVSSSRLREAVQGARAIQLLGLNVTIPHKVAVIPFLDALSSDAKAIGAVNTILNRNGKLVGYNTDGAAAIDLLQKAYVSLKGSEVALVGTGGAARAIGYHLAKRGASLKILNRTLERAKILATRLRRLGGNHKALPLSKRSLLETIQKASVVVNATPIRSESFGLSTFNNGRLFREGQVLLDASYARSPTPLSIGARRSGARVITGIDLLLAQGALSFTIWTGRRAPTEVMRRAILAELRRHSR